MDFDTDNSQDETQDFNKTGVASGNIGPWTETAPRVNHGQAHKKAVCGEFGGDKTTQDTPLLFNDLDTPDIPVGLMSGWLGEYVDAVARHTQTPPAMAVMLALATVATCTAKRFDVSPHGGDYVEPLPLWVAVVMPPASRKTAVFKAMTAPLVEYEKFQVEQLAPLIRDVALRREVIEQRIDKLKKDAARTNEPAKREALFSEIATLQADLPELILVPQLWTSDITSERLQGLLVDHGERMAVLSDEGGIFENMAGLYGDGRANLDIFLKGHAGSAVRVDRQGRTANLDAPAITFGLAIQPAVMTDMASGGKKRFRGNGTLARFLYAVPRSNVGSRDVREVYSIPQGVAMRYRDGLFRLLAVPPQMIDGREVARRLTLTVDALDSWHAFGEMIEKRQGPGGELESIADWSGKLPGAALRIAGILHLVEYGANPPAQIGPATMERALDLCDLLIDHAKAAFAMMEADPATADAKAIYQWIEAGRLARFRRGEVYRQLKGRFTGKQERLDKALRELEARAIVTAATEPTAGRAATIYIVNPTLWGGA